MVHEGISNNGTAWAAGRGGNIAAQTTGAKVKYSEMHVSELRKTAKAVFENAAWVTLANRDELTEALETKKVPPRFDGGEDPLAKLQGQMDAVGPILKDFSEFLETFSKEALDDLGRKGSFVKREAERVGTGYDQMRSEYDRHMAELRSLCDSSAPSKPIAIQLPDMTIREAGLQHKEFARLVQVLAIGLPAYLCGPAGSGKTQGAEEAAKALGLPFHPQSVCQQTSKADLLGYINPGDGKVVRTPFREAYENGGVYLLDEIDAGNPNITLILNAALANGGCSFPDAYVVKHKDFRCVAAANTFGSGADRMYVGRNQIDAATLSRFVFIVWDYDERFERMLSGNEAWAKRVQAIRKAAVTLQARIIISPRASINGAKMLAAGMSQDITEDAVVFGGVDKDLKKKILGAIK